MIADESGLELLGIPFSYCSNQLRLSRGVAPYICEFLEANIQRNLSPQQRAVPGSPSVLLSPPDNNFYFVFQWSAL